MIRPSIVAISTAVSTGYRTGPDFRCQPRRHADLVDAEIDHHLIAQFTVQSRVDPIDGLVRVNGDPLGMDRLFKLPEFTLERFSRSDLIRASVAAGSPTNRFFGLGAVGHCSARLFLLIDRIRQSLYDPEIIFPLRRQVLDNFTDGFPKMCLLSPKCVPACVIRLRLRCDLVSR